MCPSRSLSKTDNMEGSEEMRYLVQPRGPGKSYVFRMATPPQLVGKVSPFTGKPFGAEIKLGLKTRRLPEAQRQRDIYLGRVRELVAVLEGGARFSLSRAEDWAQAIAAHEDATEGRPGDLDVRGVVLEEIEQAENLPPSKRPRKDTLRKFARVALRTGYPLDQAVSRYLEERAVGNRQGFRPLRKTTVNDINTAVGYLKTFMEGGEGLCLQDIDRKQAQRFRYEFLPMMKTPRAPEGLSAKTIGKHVTLLSGIWVWAKRRGFIDAETANPWVGERGVPMVKVSKRNGVEVDRTMFTPDQAATILRAFPHGDRVGDVFRLSLVTGWRADEIASLKVTDVDEGAMGLFVRDGKTENARRYAPLMPAAQKLVRERLKRVKPEDGGRLFPEWPIRESSGKAAALSQAFTRHRRKLLGKDTDGFLSLHSARHTWRTMARRAGVPDAAVNDLGGWAGQRTSSSVYDHRLLKDQLREAQKRIWERLKAEGYLKAF